jgi:hypothetical protein
MIATTRISMMPSQKLGTDRPSSAPMLASHSVQEPRRTAASTPAPTPNRMATSRLSSASSRVTGSRVSSWSRTGSWEV